GLSEEIGLRSTSNTHLPGFDCCNRPDQHHNFQNQTVAQPKNQHQLNQRKCHQATTKAEPAGYQKSQRTPPNIAKGISTSGPQISQLRRFKAIAVDDELRVFQNLPTTLQHNRQAEPPTP